jgi:hypothetical protein
MRYSTGSRVEINGMNCTVVVTNWKGEPVTVKIDKNDRMISVRPDDKVKPIIQK